MRRTMILTLALAFTAGCAGPDETYTDTMADVPGVTLADFAGTWEGPVRPQGSDSVVANVELLATSSNDGWSFTVVNAANPVQASTTPARVVAFEGDSVILEAGPFASILREGEQVTTRSVYRLQGDRMVGMVEATYPATGETVTLNSEATRRR
ncbi:hypothetical protein BH23GEM2_BH23GEM2_12860 [soil metagenome]